MPYFSRLTDIVTCSISALLETAENPQAALVEIIYEMREGVAGAQRSVKTATENVSKLESEIGEQRKQVDYWIALAKEAINAGNDTNARRSLLRKHELQDLIAGLEQQLQAAVVTRNHLRTTQNALEARLADALRRQRDLGTVDETKPATEESITLRSLPTDRISRVETELEELKRQLEGSK